MDHDSDGGNNSIKKEKVIKGFGLQVLSLKSRRVHLSFACCVNKSCYCFVFYYFIHYIKSENTTYDLLYNIHLALSIS